LHSRVPHSITSALLGATCLLSCVTGCSGEEAGPSMNVILITMDTMRADYLSCYGRPDQTTPNLDALARKGARFELVHSTSAVTPVSHASILTGLNQYRHGLRVVCALSGYRLPENIPTLATRLKAAGYHTAAIHSSFNVSAFFGFDHGFDTFESFDAEMHVEVPKDDSAEDTGGGLADWNVRKLQRRSDETTNMVLDYLKGAKTPFFLWIHYWDPHDAMLLPPPDFRDYRRGLARLSAPEQHKALYTAEVEYQDQQIGRLLDDLEQTGFFEHSMMVVTADHGEGLGEHGWASHRILYQEQMHVPLIVRVPGGKAGLEVNQLVGVVNIAPTVLDYVGLESNDVRELDGVSLRPLLEGRTLPAQTLYADQINGYDFNARMVRTRPQADFLYSITRDPWKLIYRPSRFDESELYDLRDDPDEENNLWSKELDVRRDLTRELARLNPWCTRRFPDQSDLDAGAREAAGQALETLGYAGGEDPDAQADPKWAWTCIDHPQVMQETRGRCPVAGCNLLLLLRSRAETGR